MTSIISKVVSRFIQKQAEGTLSKGDILKVWMKRGDWWSEVKRGLLLEVVEVSGETLRIAMKGMIYGGGWEMKLPPGQDLSGKFKLDGDKKFGRALVVEKV
jgi:hypothetical protein